MSHWASRLPFHYGWVIVFTGVLNIFACFGLARFAFGVLLPGMRSGLALGYDQMGYISTGNFAGYLASVALTPLLIRILGSRALIVSALLLIAGCMLGISQSHGFITVLALYFLVGVGGGFANIPTMILASQWFRRERRGRAAGLMVAGSGVGMIFSGFLIPHLNRVVGAEGWRTGWLVLGLITLGCAATAAILVRNSPADLGLQPCGRDAAPPAPGLVPKEAAGATHIRRLASLTHPTGVDRSPAAPMLRLGALYLIFGATYMVYGTFIVTALVVEFGFPETRAGLLWSWVGFFSLFSGVVFGTLSDRIGRKGGLMVVFLIQTAAYLLAGSGYGNTSLLLSVFLYGISALAIPAIMAVTVGDYAGLSRAAAAFSAITLFFAIGQIIGPAASGMLAEASGTLTYGFLASAALTGCAVLLAAFLPKPGATD